MMNENKVHRLALLWATGIIYFVELILFIYVTVGYFETGYETLGWLTAGMLIVFAVVTMVTSILLLVADLMDKGTMERPVWLYVVRIILSLLLLDLVFRLIEYTYKTLRTVHHRNKYSQLMKQVQILLILQTFFGSVPHTTTEVTAWIVLDNQVLVAARAAKLGVSLVSMLFGMVTLFYLLNSSKENYPVSSSQFTDPERLIERNSKDLGKTETTSRCWVVIQLLGWYALLLARIGAMALLIGTLLDFRYAVIFVAVYNVTIRVLLMELWNCGKCQEDYSARLINAIMVFCYVDVVFSAYRRLRMVAYYLLSSAEIVIMAIVGFSRYTDPTSGQLGLFIVVLVLLVYCVVLLCIQRCCRVPNSVSVLPRETEGLQKSDTDQTYALTNGTAKKSNTTSKNTNSVTSNGKKQPNPKTANQKGPKTKQRKKSVNKGQKNASQHQKNPGKGQQDSSKGQQKVSNGQPEVSDGQQDNSKGQQKASPNQEQQQNDSRQQNDSSSDSSEDRRNGAQSQHYRDEDSGSVHDTKQINISSAESEQNNSSNPDTSSHETPENNDTNRERSSSTHHDDTTNPSQGSAASANDARESTGDSRTTNKRQATSTPNTTHTSGGKERGHFTERSKTTISTPANRAATTAGKSPERKPAAPVSPRRYDVPPPRTKPYLSSLAHAQQIYKEPQIYKTMPTS